MGMNNGNVIAPDQWQRATLLEQFEVFSVARWEGRAKPQRRWVVEGLIPEGQVVMLSGDGGKGKSLLIQQLLTALALGDQWVGHTCNQMPVLGIFCEDSEEELQIRQMDINQFYQCDMAEMADHLYLQSRLNMLSYLAGFDKFTDEMEKYGLWDQLCHKVRELGIRVLALDTVRKVYGGSEVNEKQVSQFLLMLRRLAVEMQGAVILSAHPSNEGLNSGSGRFGSGAWHNDVRGRMYLTDPPKPKNGSDPVDPDRRELKTMKNNYGKNGGNIPLRWERGVFVVQRDRPLHDWHNETALRR
jgi:RecA-family ATPase